MRSRRAGGATPPTTRKRSGRAHAATEGRELYPRFSPEEFARRHAAARAAMVQEGADVLVVYGDSSLNRHGQADVLWLSGFLPNRYCYVVVGHADPPVAFVQTHNHVPNAREAAVIEARWGGPDSTAAVAQYVRTLHTGPGILGYAGPVPVQAYLTWQRLLPGWAFRDISRAVRRLRLVKSDEEIAWVRRGAALTDRAVQALIDGVRPGLREMELGALVEAAGRAAGGLVHLVYLSSTPQDASTVCVPRQNLSDRVVTRGDVVNCEVSISYWGYSGQMHRPIFVQAEPNALHRRLWDVALEAYTRCVAVLRPGATVEEVLNAAEVIHEAGFTINDSVLHGFVVGLLPPSVRTRRTADGPHDPFTFEAGMCVVVQPNVVTPDERAGVQVGNLFLITATGAECLHRLPVQYYVTR
ncbi:MAG: Xaa-Pro peptidase family protein [Armatimonadota bacterium]|nr:Xaa-Pro peptidase family protein [Armatimonadota bacterium]MDR7486819.1 Xaa-Pro peptidase family protein [Armatimonadota bacterium]MDR7533842.1 Xaa-Pro peptidase family protein [Armatimonadota bacterium]MDR7535090.1 Xaa-Pro peptidase family protein [Armatimonadota bacterium]